MNDELGKYEGAFVRQATAPEFKQRERDYYSKREIIILRERDYYSKREIIILREILLF